MRPTGTPSHCPGARPTTLYPAPSLNL
jgi:hypothetical protein